MADARTVLAQRNALAALAERDGLRLPGDLQTLFEGGLVAEASARAEAERAAILAIADARAVRSSDDDILSRIGMIGEDPDADLTAARTALARGDLPATLAAADRAHRAWTVAWQEGRRRALLAIAVLATLLVLGSAVVAQLRRSRRSARAGPRWAPPRERAPLARFRGPRRRTAADAAHRRRRLSGLSPTIRMRRAPAAAALALLLVRSARCSPPRSRDPRCPPRSRPAVALAADDIEITTEARYTVDPRDAVVHVVVDITAVNRKPDLVTGTGATRYFFDGVNLGVQPEAKRLRATQDGAPVDVSAVRREGYRLVTVAFPDNLYFGETARLRLTFDLPAGEPRSTSDVRVGPAFATFTAWAFGDEGTVRIEVPEAFEVDIAGERMEREGSSGQHRAWTADATDASSWYAWVNATERRRAHRATGSRLAEGDEVVIRGWPDDRRWRNLVRELLEDGVPALVERIGLPWPVDGALEVTEVHTPLLEGYAGFYDPETDRITISEDLDDLTIVHEASHAWFNGELFTERWISEGLADEYAARVLGDLGRGAPSPERVGRRDDSAFPLGEWPPPAAIRDEEAGERESWGYAAAWQLMRRIVDRVGEDGMREVLAAAHAGTVAYPGEAAPEQSRLGNDWRRFLDLVEVAEAGPGGVEAGPDDRSIAGLLEQWVLPDPEQRLLPARAEALEAYAGRSSRRAMPGLRPTPSGWRSTGGTSRTRPTSSSRPAGCWRRATRSWPRPPRRA